MQTEQKGKNPPNKIADGLSKLFDKAEGMKMKADNSGDAIMENNSFEKFKRPHTANPIKRRSKFGNKCKIDEDISMSSESEYSSSDSEMEEEKDEIILPKCINKGISQSPMMGRRGKKKSKWGNKNTHIEIVSSVHPNITPQMRKRSLLIINNRNNSDKKDTGLFKFDMKTINTNKETHNSFNKSKGRKPKKQNLFMTPAQTVNNNRKLLQMKTAGVVNPLTGIRVKEEHDVQNMKPSSEYFSLDRMSYVNQLKEDNQAVKLWRKSFSEAINEVKIENKELLDSINPKFCKRFAQAPGGKRKTIVFGLDGVLVKTNFEKDHDDWKPTTLILDENTGAKIKIYVSIRPYVVNTLKQLKRSGCEIILYSTSQYNYTSAILEVLNKQRIDFHHIITSEDHEQALKTEKNPLNKIVKSK